MTGSGLQSPTRSFMAKATIVDANTRTLLQRTAARHEL